MNTTAICRSIQETRFPGTSDDIVNPSSKTRSLEIVRNSRDLHVRSPLRSRDRCGRLLAPLPKNPRMQRCPSAQEKIGSLLKTFLRSHRPPCAVHERGADGVEPGSHVLDPEGVLPSMTIPTEGSTIRSQADASDGKCCAQPDHALIVEVSFALARRHHRWILPGRVIAPQLLEQGHRRRVLYALWKARCRGRICPLLGRGNQNVRYPKASSP